MDLLQQIQSTTVFTVDGQEYNYEYDRKIGQFEPLIKGSQDVWQSMDNSTYQTARAAQTAIVYFSMIYPGKVMEGSFSDLIQWWPKLQISGLYDAYVVVMNEGEQEMYRVLATGEEYGSVGRELVVVETVGGWGTSRVYDERDVIEVFVFERDQPIEFPILWTLRKSGTYSTKRVEVNGDMYIPMGEGKWDQSISMTAGYVFETGTGITPTEPSVNWAAWGKQSASITLKYSQALAKASEMVQLVQAISDTKF